MFILEEPYVSDFCIDTLKKNFYPILKTKIVEEENLNFISDEDFVSNYQKTNKLYTNSENSIQRIEKLLKKTNLPSIIRLFKDKIKTRELLSKIYPDFFYQKVTHEELKNFNEETLKYPLVIKPAVGFLSFGVYTVWDKKDFKNTVKELKKSMDKVKSFFPENVLSDKNFIIEDYIEGDEFAVDVYFNSNSNPVILNIFQHPFADSFDVSDRMYITSSSIISKHLKPFGDLFEKVGKCVNLQNFPAHIELRVKDNNIIPIEVNPLRFAGWCLTDIAYFAYGINPYEYFMEEKEPNWESIIEKESYLYAFVMSEVPQDIEKDKIESFDFEKFKQDLNAEIVDVRHYDFKVKPMFNSLFIKAKNYDDIKHILKLDMKKYIKFRK